ncbi:unnamed protein product [Caenorhabditis bovis]|uniref:Uncharacterized protein n=1 Tax=Caenorhabditis bovis TaxID=2654633 RepID=A0A8S1FB68_9PELO|nr:unnamed protein product [Caenorhabditis bovis]
MPLVDGNAIAGVALDSVHFMLTIAILIATVTLVSICACCGTKEKESKDQDECDYGVVAAPSKDNTTIESGPSRTINIRSITKAVRNHDRHSQPVGTKNAFSSNRQSAPGRALPQLPADLYTPIDKKRDKDDIRFVDETINPMYECIDAETDSFVDPLYSKVGEVRGNPNGTRDRRYDYPIFPGRQTGQPRPSQDDTLYQSASQIYAPGSEDPYSSITSERERNIAAADGDGDTSSAYDPGYAKVTSHSKPKKQNGKSRLEKTERELDLLYSKIRRPTPSMDDDLPGPSRIDPINVPLPPTDPIPQPVPYDSQSVASREPSYRYITMRENADSLRERLRQEGKLDRPIREHYYSTIGNDYETINTPNASYSGRNFPLPVPEQNPVFPNNSLTISLTPNDEAPPPPTSPIPDRTSSMVSMVEPPELTATPVPATPAYAVVVKNRNNGHPSNEAVAPPPLIYTSLNHPNGVIDGSSRQGAIVAQINEFVNRPTLPYRSLDTLIGRGTVEEKEVIVDTRSSMMSGIPSQPSPNGAMSRSVDTSWEGPTTSRRIHEVHIEKIAENHGPSADEIISGRRYRGGLSSADDGQKAVQNGIDLNKNSVDGARSSDDLRGSEKSKKNPWKEETEDEKIKRLGTIYTANDYVSSIDMSNDKPWPLSSRSNEPSSSKEE